MAVERSIAMHQSESRRGPFAVLLGSLLFFMVMIPFVTSDGAGAIFVRVGLSIVLLAGIYAASAGRWVLGVAVVLALPAFGIQWWSLFFEFEGEQALRRALMAVFLGFTVVVVLRSLIAQERVSMDTILGGINVYLLLGLAFMLVHGTLESVAPGSYRMGEIALSHAFSAEGGWEASTLLYFSFTTLTTLGYGDIAPVSALARMACSAEAVMGQLYVAIFIARLVSLYVAGHARTGG